MNTTHLQLISSMIEYYRGDAKRIQHFIKVYNFASLLGRQEQLDEETLFILETAAIVHDIGIRICEQKYGVCDGKHQELEGPAEAEKLLIKTGNYTCEQLERVCWLVGHHHTYTNISGIDYQLLVEADFLVNIFEDGFSAEMIENVKNKIFRTQSGIRCLEDMYLKGLVKNLR